MERDLIHINIEKQLHTVQGVINLKIDTSICSEEITAIFGDSGTGKTTLLRMIAGLTVPDRGQIRFGQQIWYDSELGILLPPQQRNISLMFQDYALFPNMTVEQNISYAQTKKDSDALSNLLSVFGLTELKNRRPEFLSGGQKQRVALARAIARKPLLLLLDEPLSALDNEMRSSLQEEIKKVHDLLKITTIMVSHDLSEVFRLASQVVVIKDGQISKKGSPNEVFTDSNISGKVQITGKIAHIEKQDILYIVTVISGNQQILKVIAFENDLTSLSVGDQVMVYSKAFNPIIGKLR